MKYNFCCCEYILISKSLFSLKIRMKTKTEKSIETHKIIELFLAKLSEQKIQKKRVIER